MHLRPYFAALLLAMTLPLAHASPTIEGKGGAAVELSGQPDPTKGVILMAVSWKARWGCGEAEHAKLEQISFRRLPLKDSDTNAFDLRLTDELSLFRFPAPWDYYALQLEPGEYALNSTQVYSALDVSQVSKLVVDPARLLKDGKPQGGSFKVNAGEVAYIGEFALDCYQQPMLWRYYIAAQGMPKHLHVWKDKYPSLAVDRVAFRLFDTKVFGRPPKESDLPSPQDKGIIKTNASQ